jgi:hypothetical protein
MEGSKNFFFEKKKQKTFVNLDRAGGTSFGPGEKSFLVLFFKKELLSYFLLLPNPSQVPRRAR